MHRGILSGLFGAAMAAQLADPEPQSGFKSAKAHAQAKSKRRHQKTSRRKNRGR